MDPYCADQLVQHLKEGASRRALLRRLGAGGLAAGVGLTVSRGLARAQATPSAATAPIPAAWAAAWTSHDSARVAALFTEDGTYEDLAFGLVAHGIEGVKAFADGFFAASPDLSVDLTAGFQSADWAAAEWLFSGTDRGVFPGRPPSGRRFSVRGATIFALRDGKVVRDTDYYNLVTLQEQLGVIPAAETPTT
jgi:steroid delta-isomerase-like uncharacterized protein